MAWFSLFPAHEEVTIGEDELSPLSPSGAEQLVLCGAVLATLRQSLICSRLSHASALALRALSHSVARERTMTSLEMIKRFSPSLLSTA